MDNITHLQSELENSVGANALKKIELFLMVYSRFEFALLDAGLIYRTMFADWHDFARRLITSFNRESSDELSDACSYILVSPPNKHNGTVWEPVELNHDLSDCEKLIRYINTIRNNLFHGSKVPFAVLRDTLLIDSALIILDYCISISPTDIKAAFWAGLTSPEAETNTEDN